MKLHVALTKIDEKRRLVTGRVTEEIPDASGEVMDFSSSRPNFEAWSAQVHKDSGGKSFGNVRAMHSAVAAGKLNAIHFNDHDKAIDVEAKIVDDQEWRKVLDGVYTGFSIGGKYAKRWNDIVDGKPVTKFTAAPNEISLVDRPCCPTAKFFDVLKTDGTLAKVAFKYSTETDHMFSLRKKLEGAFGSKNAARLMIASALDGGSALRKALGSELGDELMAAIRSELAKGEAQTETDHPEISDVAQQDVHKLLKATFSRGPAFGYMANLVS